MLSNVVIWWKFSQRACELAFAMSEKEAYRKMAIASSQRVLSNIVIRWIKVLAASLRVGFCDEWKRCLSQKPTCSSQQVLSNTVIWWKFSQRACELAFAMSGKDAYRKSQLAARSECFQIQWFDESSRSEFASWLLRWVEKMLIAKANLQLAASAFKYCDWVKVLAWLLRWVEKSL